MPTFQSCASQSRTPTESNFVEKTTEPSASSWKRGNCCQPDGFMLDRGVYLNFMALSDVAEAVSLNISADQTQVLATVDAESGPETSSI